MNAVVSVTAAAIVVLVAAVPVPVPATTAIADADILILFVLLLLTTITSPPQLQATEKVSDLKHDAHLAEKCNPLFNFLATLLENRQVLWHST